MLVRIVRTSAVGGGCPVRIVGRRREESRVHFRLPRRTDSSEREGGEEEKWRKGKLDCSALETENQCVQVYRTPPKSKTFPHSVVNLVSPLHML